MSTVEAVQTTKATSNATTSAMVLQGKCACGGSAGLSGECEGCKTKKLLGKPLQKKLAISEPGDAYEQEADRIADQVMAVPTPMPPSIGEKPLQINRFSGQSNGSLNTAPANVNQVLTSPGRPLDMPLRQDMERRFGHDFSLVRVHTGSAAQQSARDVNAHAYTVGHNMVFGAGRFVQSTDAGRRLIAHELTHVVQQASKAPGSRSLGLPRVSSSGASMLMREAMTREDILKRMAELQAVLNDMSFTAVQRKDAQKEFTQLSVLLQKGEVRKGPSAVIAVGPPSSQSSVSKPKVDVSLALSPNASIQEIINAMEVIDAIKPSETAGGLFQTTFKGRVITLTMQQVDKVRASAVKALTAALTNVERRRDSAVGRYNSQEQVNEEFPVSSGASKAWSWIRTYGEYSNPRESVRGEAKKVTDESALARQAMSSTSFAEAVRHLSAADAASERSSKIVHAYIDQLISGAESLEIGLTYTRDAAFVTVGVLAVVATGGAALGLEASTIGTGIGGLTVAQTTTAISVGAPIAGSLGVAGLKVAAGDKVDWGQFAVETAVQIILAKFGGKLSAGIAGKLVGNPATATLGRQVIATLMSGAATHVVSQSFSVTVSSVHRSLQGKNVTWDTFLDQLINALTDPTGWFMVALSSGVHAGVQVKVSNALKTQAGGGGTLANEPSETGIKSVLPNAGNTTEETQVVSTATPADVSSSAASPKQLPTGPPPMVPSSTKVNNEPPLKGYFGGGGGEAGRKGMRTTPMADVEKAPQLKTQPSKPLTTLSDAERAMVRDADEAVFRLGRPLSVKTKSGPNEGDIATSGFGGSKAESTRKVMDTGKEIGHDFAKNSSLDGGIPGQERAGHAEKLAAINNPGKALAVDKAMCPDCFDFFQKLARARGTSIAVQEPTTTWVFRPDGMRVGLPVGSKTQIVIYSDGSASAGPAQ